MPEVVRFRFEPGQDETFAHVPFTVPRGVEQFHISIDYNDRIGSSPTLTGGNTLDIGLFDELGIHAGSPGFRGWSGSERTEITIGESWSTPPYRSGSISAGVWHLVLGAYKIGPNGLNVTGTITFNPDIASDAPPPQRSLAELRRAALPPSIETNWYRGDLHMHSVYSDGDSFPHEIAERVYESGLDFYAITDHNRAQSAIDLVEHGDGWPVIVRGVEVTTYKGHFNVWGTDAWYEFRSPTTQSIQAAVDAAHADGGLVSLNHPKPYGPMWDLPDVTGFDAIEPWNGWWGRLNTISIGYWADELATDSPDNWHAGVCGSDAHHLKSPGNPAIPISEASLGNPTLWIKSEGPLTETSILDAIRTGNCSISDSPSGPQLITHHRGDTVDVHVGGAAGDCLMMIGAHACIAAFAVEKNDQVISIPTTDLVEPYIRFELHVPGGGLRAMTNPVWL